MTQSQIAKHQHCSRIILFTTNWCPDCHRAKLLLDEHGIDYVNVDVDEDEGGLAFVKQVNNGRRVVPTIVLSDGTILVEPSNALLAEKAGLEDSEDAFSQGSPPASP